MINVKRIPSYAEQSLLYELAISPKPGLVDRFNTGSHEDMNFFTFLDSTIELGFYFSKYFQAGINHEGELKDLFLILREMGKLAELAMLNETRNVNTHKGINFSFALILGSLGYLVSKNEIVFPLSERDTQKVFFTVKKMVRGITDTDLENKNHNDVLSNGEKAYLVNGTTGVRGEAERGYPVLTKIVLPFLRSNAKKDVPKEELYLRALILSMSHLEDSNLVHRGGVDGLKDTQLSAKKIHDSNFVSSQFFEQVKDFDNDLIQKNFSPGGSADILALAIFFGFLEELT
ncbi:triphosphoribosyl-dephospho-CoA synthase CitG [Enterococcus gallinarum]|uniref:triphosphoribosyl-dephospho-CoA synthase CitG n=1 Tax=Enterococcus gallinarum TaxID=1353 RepID=UPI0018A91828|nr:triphosphoribosyl-dephospho-CoA synthase CitG [Enterococcus gallinarum]